MVAYDSRNDKDDHKKWKQSSSSSLFLRRMAGALGASGVALGAIGAHAFKETLTKRGTVAIWQTATIYHLFHATAILALGSNATNNRRNGPSSATRINGGTAANNKASNSDNNNNNSSSSSTIPGKSSSAIVPDQFTLLLAGKLLAVGTVMFSGSIYCLALNVGPKALLGPTTPIGGLIMIGGWIVAGLSNDGQ
jgi:uncharacterized membrane protein YgdD (TMEM256/DUF423 family)